MPFTLEDILPEDQTPRTVQLHELVPNVLNVMHQHDYGQLPVVDQDGKTSLDQVVTFDGVVQAIQSFGTHLELLQVRDVARRAKTYAADADLLATLDDIQRDNFALIVNDKNHLTGIVTTADTTVFFREYAQDLMQIEGIESHLKEVIRSLYTGDDPGLNAAIETVTDRAADTRKRLPLAIKAYLGKAGIEIPISGSDGEAIKEAEKKLGLPEANKTFENLSFDEFTQVLLRHPDAANLSTKNVAELRRLLEHVRNARNKLAHFRGELSSEERRTIQFAAEWLERNLIVAERPPIAMVSSTDTVKIVTEATPMHEVIARDEVEPGPHGSYAPLAKYLEGQDPALTSVTLMFQDIETILKKELPRSAFEYRAWWSNDPTKPQSAAWLDEGWRTMSISMAERRLTFARTNDLDKAYISFFAKLNTRLEAEKLFPLRNCSPQGQNWMILASFKWIRPEDPQVNWIRPEAANINAQFARRKEFRIELYLDCGDEKSNKQRFDELYARRSIIEGIAGEPLRWERMDNNRACRVAAYTKAQILADVNNPSLLDWAVNKALSHYRAFAPEFPASH
jgi:CBS domain-containing protein